MSSTASLSPGSGNRAGGRIARISGTELNYRGIRRHRRWRQRASVPLSGERKNQRNANLAAVNGLFVFFLSYLLFAVFGIFFARIYFTVQTSNPEIIQQGTTYLSICSIFSFGIFLEIALERIMQSTGRTIYNMITQGLGAIINIILDPILIFGLLGFPEWEFMGAAVATVIGQITAMLLLLYFNITKNTDVNLNMRSFARMRRLSLKSTGLDCLPSSCSPSARS